MYTEMFESWLVGILFKIASPLWITLAETRESETKFQTARKQEIIEFLYAQDLYFQEGYTKKQLLEALKTREFHKLYEIVNNE